MKTNETGPLVNRRQSETDVAWRILMGHFDGSKAIRSIRGCAISSRRPNFHGTSFVAQGMVRNDEPVPLLLEHEWHMPIGKVIGVKVVGDRLLFNAVIANSDGLYWAKQVWERIVERDVSRISVEGDSLVEPIYDRTFRCWRLTEVSVVGAGADDGAVIERVAEHLPFVFCDGRSSETLHWSARS